jgi:hypothetical protein
MNLNKEVKYSFKAIISYWYFMVSFLCFLTDFTNFVVSWFIIKIKIKIKIKYQ